MNPLSNPTIGQATHREYEANYGHSYQGEKKTEAPSRSTFQQRFVLALGGLSIIGTIIAFFLIG